MYAMHGAPMMEQGEEGAKQEGKVRGEYGEGMTNFLILNPTLTHKGHQTLLMVGDSKQIGY